jgi:hypothetical protein
MKGDFTRDSFEAVKRFRRVLLQQGRVQLDADVNEQTAIFLHQATLLTTSVVGRFGGPRNAIDTNGRWAPNNGFLIRPGDAGFAIGPGHYYVDGILCENFETQQLLKQADFPTTDADKPNFDQPFLVYLEVFERALAAVQDDAIAEPALEGLDTATRSRVIWQVKTLLPGANNNLKVPTAPPNAQEWNAWLDILDPPGRGLLRARANSDVATDEGPCVVPISSKFRGEDNQLYRVEIHDGGGIGQATFKWSRENGSVLFPIESMAGETVTVTTLGRDRRYGLQPGDWVEITDDERDLRREHVLPLFKVDSIKRDQRLVVLKKQNGVDLPEYESGDPRHPLLRRWDGGAAAKIAEVADGSDTFISLENGVQVQFLQQPQVVPRYRSGDYWLIPARVALGDIIWPRDAEGNRQALGPRGIDRHFAPLAGWATAPTGAFIDLRRLFDGLGG